MDVLGTVWSGFMTQIQTACLTNSTRSDEEVKTFLDRMLNLLKHKSHLHCHTEYFKQYINEGVYPLGLRIQLFPTVKDPSPAFKSSWEKTLTHCSLELMRTLITQYESDMTSLDSEIDKLNTHYQHLLDAPSFSNRWREVREHLEELTKENIKNKQTKFVKDKLAFSEGLAYKWSGRMKGRKAVQHDISLSNVTVE